MSPEMVIPTIYLWGLVGALPIFWRLVKSLRVITRAPLWEEILATILLAALWPIIGALCLLDSI